MSFQGISSASSLDSNPFAEQSWCTCKERLSESVHLLAAVHVTHELPMLSWPVLFKTMRTSGIGTAAAFSTAFPVYVATELAFVIPQGVLSVRPFVIPLVVSKSKMLVVGVFSLLLKSCSQNLPLALVHRLTRWRQEDGK